MRKILILILLVLPYTAIAQWDNLKIIYVIDETELSQNIGSDRTIILNTEKIILNNTIVLSKLKNIKIKGAFKGKPTQLVIDDILLPVFYLKQCTNIFIENIEAGHFGEKGECNAGVMDIFESNDIQIEDCVLYGSGEYGVYCDHVINIQFFNSIIRDCSQEIFHLSHTELAVFKSCIFRDNDFENFSGRFLISGCSSMLFENCLFTYNKTSNFFFEHLASNPDDIRCCVIDIENSLFENNFSREFSNFPEECIYLRKVRQKSNSFILNSK